MKLFKILTLLLGCLVVFACTKKAPERLVFEFEDYIDPYYKFQFKSPKGWVLTQDPGKMKLLSSALAYDRFADPTSQGETGAMFSIDITPFGPDTTGTPDSIVIANRFPGFVNEIKSGDREWLGDPPYDKEADVQVAGYPAKKMEYAVAFAKNVIMKSEKYAVVVDTLGYLIEFKSFNEKFELYKPAYDTLISSLILPRAVRKSPEEAALDEVKPSAKYLPYSGGNITMKFPDNFNAAAGSKKGEIEFAIVFQGYRQDCNVQLDIFPAKGLPVEKVLEQNEGRYKVKGKGEAKIAGEKALYINYSLVKDVNSRVYFMVKNDKIYRVTLNWFKEMEADFLPVFENMVNSLAVKS